MGYELYLDGILLPIAPSKIEISIKNQNKTLNLINDKEINILKDAGLTEITFDAVIPHIKYNYATYLNGFKDAAYFLNKFKDLKVNKKPFQFICSRMLNSNELLFDTNIKVSMEAYKIIEDTAEGQEVIVSIFLKQCIDYGTKIINTEVNKKGADSVVNAFVETKRSEDSAPNKNTYEVKKGDTLWSISKKILGDGSRYKEIIELNRNKINNPNNIKEDIVLSLPIR